MDVGKGAQRAGRGLDEERHAARTRAGRKEETLAPSRAARSCHCHCAPRSLAMPDRPLSSPPWRNGSTTLFLLFAVTAAVAAATMQPSPAPTIPSQFKAIITTSTGGIPRAVNASLLWNLDIGRFSVATTRGITTLSATDRNRVFQYGPDSSRCTSKWGGVALPLCCTRAHRGGAHHWSRQGSMFQLLGWLVSPTATFVNNTAVDGVACQRWIWQEHRSSLCIQLASDGVTATPLEMVLYADDNWTTVALRWLFVQFVATAVPAELLDIPLTCPSDGLPPNPYAVATQQLHEWIECQHTRALELQPLPTVRWLRGRLDCPVVVTLRHGDTTIRVRAYCAAN